jgi:hypothetical protein
VPKIHKIERSQSDCCSRGIAIYRQAGVFIDERKGNRCR